MLNPRVCHVNAPCKINLHLRVGQKRPDGFHELESIFAALAFGDFICFELYGDEGDWELLMNQEGPENIHIGDLIGKKNLVSQAVALFRGRTGFNRGLRCKLEKRVPLGAGLGGGSSDAAATLLALNLLADTRLSRGDLLEMAAALGSDAPFFISGGAAWVYGRGECLESLPVLDKFGVLLVKPPIHSATSEAFRLLDEYRSKKNLQIPQILKFSSEKLKSSWTKSPEKWPFFNDFLPILDETGIYRKIIEDLRVHGALFSGLSGSGSCCFGVFEDFKTAAAAEKVIKNEENYQNFTQTTFFLAQGTDTVLK